MLKKDPLGAFPAGFRLYQVFAADFKETAIQRNGVLRKVFYENDVQQGAGVHSEGNRERKWTVVGYAGQE